MYSHSSPFGSVQANDDVLDVEDVLGKRLIATRLHGNVTIREENAAAALEVMSRFAVNPKWLIYLPPTMSPPESASEPGFLEYPTEAFAYFRRQGVREVACEEKHMGSRAVIVVCRDEDAARRRFGVEGEGIGCCYTRTGRRFSAASLSSRRSSWAGFGRLLMLLYCGMSSEPTGCAWIASSWRGRSRPPSYCRGSMRQLERLLVSA